MSPVVRLQAAAAPARPFALGNLQLQGDAKLRASLGRALTEIAHEQTLEGASTITILVRDPTRALLRSMLVRTRATLALDRVQYRLVRVARQGNQVTLTFEDTAVNVLRDYDDPRKANRENTTRAQFVQSLVREPRGYQIPFRCPELNVQQPIAAAG